MLIKAAGTAKTTTDHLLLKAAVEPASSRLVYEKALCTPV